MPGNFRKFCGSYFTPEMQNGPQGAAAFRLSLVDRGKKLPYPRPAVNPSAATPNRVEKSVAPNAKRPGVAAAGAFDSQSLTVVKICPQSFPQSIPKRALRIARRKNVA